MTVISPDCEVGKCPCTGSALDDLRDAVVECQHPCHATWTAVFDNGDGTRFSPAAVESLFGQRVDVFPAGEWRDPLGTAEVVAVLPAPPDSRSEDVALTLRWVRGDRDAMAAVPTPEGRVGIVYEALRRDAVDGVSVVTVVALVAICPADPLTRPR